MRDFIVWTTAFILVFFAAVMVMLSLAALMDMVETFRRNRKGKS